MSRKYKATTFEVYQKPQSEQKAQWNANVNNWFKSAKCIHFKAFDKQAILKYNN